MEENLLNRLDSTRITKGNVYYLVYNNLFRDLKAVIGKYAQGDVLDIGCGNKPYENLFQNITSYTGCDVVQSDKKKVDIICPATEIPVKDCTKDIVFSTQVIEHVADHKGLLSEAARILKPGGYLILSGPMYWEHHEVPYDFFRFTRYGLKYLLDEVGLSPVSIIPNGGKWAMVGQVFLNSINASFQKRSAKRRLIKGMYFLFRIKWLVNVLFSWLDKVDFDDSATLNFVVVAQKPMSHN